MSRPPRPGGLPGLLIRLASWLVPRHRRSGWLEEWRSEVWHYRELRGVDGNAGGEGEYGLVWRCLGAPLHALWIRAEEWSLDMIVQDIRLALRGLVRNPGFSLVVILTLALGIGGNTAIFSVVNSVLLNPLPIENQDRLLWTWGRTWQGRNIASVSPPDYRDYLEQTGSVFDEFAAMASFSPTFTWTQGDRPIRLSGTYATHNLLAALGYEPLLGRGFAPEDNAVESPEVVMLTYPFWQEAFGGDPTVVGTTLAVDNRTYTIVGVLPEDLVFPPDRQIWIPLPLSADSYQSRASHFLRPIALLAPGMEIAEAQQVMDAVSARLEEAYPATNDEWYAQLQPIANVFVASVRPALLLLLGAVGLVLLIACANVANLLLARAAARESEIAVRASLGASRMRITRQLLTESLVMSGIAGAIGLALAYGSVALVRAYDPGNLPRIEELAVDGTAVVFTLGVAVLVGILFGLAPTLTLARTNIAGTLGEAGRGGRGGTRASRRMRSALVVAEVALSMVLLVGAGLLIQSLRQAQNVDPGFNPDGTLTFDLQIEAEGGPEAMAVRTEAVLDALEAMPGVSAAATMNSLPFSGNGGDTYVYDTDNPPDSWQNVEHVAEFRVASDGYDEVMGITLERGRFLEPTDVRGSPAVVVVNQSLAQRLWPETDPIGRSLTIALDSLTPHRVVGVIRDVRQYGFTVQAIDEFYLSQAQVPRQNVAVAVRAQGDPLAVAPRIREAVWSVDPNQPIPSIDMMNAIVARSLAPRTFQTALMGAFALLAIVLAAIGVYGVLAYAVSRETRDIGLRVALGAGRSVVVGSVVRRGLVMVAGGLAVGAVGAFFATRLLSSLLFQVAATDLVSFLGSAGVLLVVAGLASWLPARRAASVDPMVALRAE